MRLGLARLGDSWWGCKLPFIMDYAPELEELKTKLCSEMIAAKLCKVFLLMQFMLPCLLLHLSLHNINPFLASQPQRIKSNTNTVQQTSATINANKGDIVVLFPYYSFSFSNVQLLTQTIYPNIKLTLTWKINKALMKNDHQILTFS